MAQNSMINIAIKEEKGCFIGFDDIGKHAFSQRHRCVEIVSMFWFARVELNMETCE